MDYVDANILTYVFTEEGWKTEACRRLLTESDLLTSSLTLDEVGYKLFKRVSPKAAAKTLDLLISSPRLVFKPFDYDHFASFTKLVGGGISPRDAIHAATALKSGCKTIYSEDRDFDKIKGLKRKTPW